MNRPLLSVGTPGRLAEMSRMGVLQTHSTRILVLDEVRRCRRPPLCGAAQHALWPCDGLAASAGTDPDKGG